MKRLTMPALAAGLGVFLFSSCATRNGGQSDDYSSGSARQYASAAHHYGHYGNTTVAIQLPMTPGGWPGGEWPMTFAQGTAIYTIFEPQCDSWDGHQLVARSVVAVHPAGRAQPTYGTVVFHAITLVDNAARNATLADFRLISADFPSARFQTEDYVPALVINLSAHAPPLALDRLVGNMTFIPDNSSKASVKASVPGTLQSEEISWTSRFPQGPMAASFPPPPPGQMIGSVPLAPIDGTPLHYILNSVTPIIEVDSESWYACQDGVWYAATSVKGPWTVTAAVPAVIYTIPADSALYYVTQVRPGQAAAADVFGSTLGGDLISFNGEPEFVLIPGTDLLYAANTSDDLFKCLTDLQDYILMAGRWYSAASLKGPWHPVPGNELPHDFANIPDDHPKAKVKASVPGTRQADISIIANSIPQSATGSGFAPTSAGQIDPPALLGPDSSAPRQAFAQRTPSIIEVNFTH